MNDNFPTATTGLIEAARTDEVRLADGDSFELRIGPVVKRIAGADVRMLAYNGSIPGPTLRVEQGSEIEVNILNEGDHETTVHWHGLRLENRYDGTHETQPLIPAGGSYTVRVSFPDPGVYWFHPHVREDYGQELGLYGNVIVDPPEPDYWGPVHREMTLTLDDLLVEDGQIAGFSRSETSHSAMGRFGNVLLAAGEDELSIDARWGEVVRLYLTNTANTRVFRVQLPGARMKLVGGDSGRCEVEQFVTDVTLAPSERVVVDVLFDKPGELALEHRTPERVYRLASIAVSQEAATPSLAEQFGALRVNEDMVAERARAAAFFDAEPDKRLAFIAEMDMEAAVEGDGPVSYTCPMHLEVVSEEPGHCPECGMKLLPAALVAAAGGEHDHHGGHDHEHGGGHDHAAADGIEWEDDMVEVNRLTTPANMRWKLVD